MCVGGGQEGYSVGLEARGNTCGGGRGRLGVAMCILAAGTEFCLSHVNVKDSATSA